MHYVVAYAWLLFFYRLLPDSCQKVLFSATYSDVVMEFAHRVVPDPVIIRLKRNEESLDNIKQVYVYNTPYLGLHAELICVLMMLFYYSFMLSVQVKKTSLLLLLIFILL